MLIVNPNNRLDSPLAAIEPPLWAGLTASFWDADILDAEAMNLSVDSTEKLIRDKGHRDIIIVVMGNNPSVSSTPKMPISEALAERLKDLNVCLTGLHPIAAGSPYPVNKVSFLRFPMMPWNKLPMQLYRAHNWHCLDGSPRSPYASLYTSLGCPYDCYYCNIHALYGNRELKLRPVEDIAWEIDILVNLYKVRNIKIWDELFALNEDRVVKICDIFKQYENLNIWAYARLDTVTKRMLKHMRNGGIKWLAYGFESTKDKKFSNAEEAIKMTREAGISIIGNFMFGLPGSSYADDTASLDFAKKHLFEFVNIYDAKPYPGSPWWEEWKKEQKEFHYSEFSQYSNIGPFRQNAFNEYFTNPDYLAMLEKKWGSQAGKQIKEMLLWKLHTKS